MVHSEFHPDELRDAVGRPPYVASDGWTGDVLVHSASSYGGAAGQSGPRHFIRSPFSHGWVTAIGFHSESRWHLLDEYQYGGWPSQPVTVEQAEVDAALDASWRRQTARVWPHLDQGMLPALPCEEGELVRLANPWMTSEQFLTWDTIRVGGVGSGVRT